MAGGQQGRYDWRPAFSSLVATRHSVRSVQPAPATLSLPYGSGFLGGLRGGATSIYIVVVGSYISIGALAHDLGFPLFWAVLTTLLIWAAPAQVILISALGAGAAPLEVALAVGLSSMRLLPMVVALLPLVKSPKARTGDVLVTAHFTAISMWIEALRLLPRVPREARIGYANGLGTCLMGAATAATIVGYHLAQTLPGPLVAGLLFLSPMSFLMSAVRNARVTADWVALVAGLVLAPLLAWYGIGLDLMWTGIVGGILAYAAQWVREVLR
jgi:predicted branched-subunit amino acid permease